RELQVWEFDWSPTGGDFALLVSDQPYAWDWYQARLARVPVVGGEPVTLVPSSVSGKDRPQFALPRWSPDGSRIAYLTCTWSDRGVIGGDVRLVPAASGAPVLLTPDSPASFTWIEWSPDGGSLLLSA